MSEMDAIGLIVVGLIALLFVLEALD